MATDALKDSLAEHNNDLTAALKSLVRTEVRVVLEGPDIVGLNLDDTKITDTSLEHLSDLKKLRWLGLVRTDVTEEGVAQLRQALTRFFPAQDHQARIFGFSH